MEVINLTTDVLIVGAKPVGLTLANLLQRNGLGVIVIDKRVDKINSSRAITINQSSLDIFSILGFNEIIPSYLRSRQIGLVWVQKFLEKLNSNNNYSEAPSFCHLPQPEIEQHLEKNLLKLGLKINRGMELISYSQDEGSVFAKIKTHDKTFCISSKFLIGCDGRHSTVRELMNCGVNQRKYGTACVIADVTFKNYSNQNTKYIHTREGYVMIVPLAGNQYRLVFSLKPDTIKDEFYLSDTKNLQHLLNERIETEIKLLNVSWATHSSYSHQLSNQVYQNRVVLAGDALHQFEPAGGINLNTGIQDAYSLGWRLIHSIRNPALMSSLHEYALDRKKVILKQQQLTEWLTSILTLPLTLTRLKNKSNLQDIKFNLSDESIELFENYHQKKRLIKKFQSAFEKANYVLFTRGILSEAHISEITKNVQNNRHINWIHYPENNALEFAFIQPDSQVILSGNKESMHQFFNDNPIMQPG